MKKEIERGHGCLCHTLKFNIKVFYVMGKALSGKLSYAGKGFVIFGTVRIKLPIRKLRIKPLKVLISTFGCSR